MLHCDIYYPKNAGGFGDDHLYFVCADLPQCGDVSMDYTPDVELNRMENGTYAVYARERNEKTATLQFEGSCKAIQNAAACARNGSLIFTGIYMDGYTPSPFTGVYCYIDGSPTTNTISREADLMSITIPVIVRDVNTDVPALRLSLGGTNAFRFGKHTIYLSECKYLGGGKYAYPETLHFDADTESVCILGSLAGGGNATCYPEFAIQSADAAKYTKKSFVATENTGEASAFSLPFGDFACYIKVENVASNICKPFQIFFNGRRSDENAAV